MTRTLGQQLVALRHARELRLIDVATASGLSISWINDLEHDRAAPSLDTLCRLATAYDTTVIHLLTGIPPYDYSVTP